MSEKLVKLCQQKDDFEDSIAKVKETLNSLNKQLTEVSVFGTDQLSFVLLKVDLVQVCVFISYYLWSIMYKYACHFPAS